MRGGPSARPFLAEGWLRRLALVRKPKLGQYFRGLGGHRECRSRYQVGKRFGASPAECTIMNIKHLAITAVLSIAASSPVLADDQKPANFQDGNVPPLNLMMVATQLSHFKLWYAGAVQNWPLANYELEQIRASIRLAKTLFPDSDKSNMDTMKPAADDLEKAIRAKDAASFTSAYVKLT